MVVSEIYSRAALMQISMKCLEKEMFLCTMCMCILHKKLLVVIVHKLCTSIYNGYYTYMYVHNVINWQVWGVECI